MTSPSFSLYQDVLNRTQKRVLSLLIFIWFVLLTFFTLWWFDERHFASTYGLILNSLVLFWNYFIPGYFFYFLSRMKVVRKNVAIPDFLVAMVVTKAPSEPFSVLRKTLEKCLDQTFPHDVWVADEAPEKETIRWCKKHRVGISSRKGVSDYHHSQWPRRTKCKEGNLAYFYDRYGYDQYDIVVQLDIDHAPERGYLEEILRPFADERVGYVSAPSICDNNARKSWSARARLYAESIMHGPLQTGYTDGFAPLCIGSHYAVRTRALKEIGGLGPELAEDHSTTLLFNAWGWRGAHALSAIAHGDGPATFADCMTQEFQWSRSLTVLLLTLTPAVWKRLSFRLKFQFLFSQMWYPLFASVMLLGVSLPLIAILSGETLVSIPYLSFLLLSITLDISVAAVVLFLRRNGLLRPKNARIISWEVVVFQLTRWPYVLYGIAMGVLDVMARRSFAFVITPKGDSTHGNFPLSILNPYIAIIALYLGVLYFSEYAPDIAGYYYFSYLIVCYYFLSIGIVLARHAYERKVVS